jgi:hypothetical protein
MIMTSLLRIFALAAVAAIAVSAMPSAVAQDLIFRPEEPAPKPSTSQGSSNRSSSSSSSSKADSQPPVSALPSCVTASFTVTDRAADGDLWDQPGRLPDPRITETTTGTTGKCNNSFTCSMQIRPTGQTLRFSIVDYDPLNADDPIGTGQCRIGSSCSFGQVSVRIDPC